MVGKWIVHFSFILSILGSLPLFADTLQDTELITSDPTILEFIDRFSKQSDSSDTILLFGETGVGKEMIAKRLHAQSARKDKPFLVIDCGNITSTIAESELFGHEKGAYTGAVSDRASVFESAKGGTVFLDEIENLTPRLQAMLLRALEIDPAQRTVRRIGGHENIPIDVRIIVATNQDLEKLVEEGLFRRDLFYRLNVHVLNIPPLRERRTDIPQLARYFLSRFSRGTKVITQALEEYLVMYEWPGNVRELRNVMLKMSLFSDNLELEPQDLPPQMRQVLEERGFPISIERKPSVDVRTLAPEVFEGVITRDSNMLALLNNVWKMRDVEYPVLVEGETGTGKELIANVVHRSSSRAHKPFYAVNCAAISETLAESELFGYVKGAFTGAGATRPGAFEIVKGGTLFLDEVEALSPKLQALLLRVLETGQIRRVGSISHMNVEFRVIAASNQSLAELVRQGKFREDLYHRLNVVTLTLPPLREREADIPLLAESFAEKRGKGFHREALAYLVGFPWRGNIRELEAVVTRLSFEARDEMISIDEVTKTLPSSQERRADENLSKPQIRDVLEFKEWLVNYVVRELQRAREVSFEDLWRVEVERRIVLEVPKFFENQVEVENTIRLSRRRYRELSQSGEEPQNIIPFAPSFFKDLMTQMLFPYSYIAVMAKLEREVAVAVFQRAQMDISALTRGLKTTRSWWYKTISYHAHPEKRVPFEKTSWEKSKDIPSEFMDADISELSQTDWIMRHFLDWREKHILMEQVAKWLGVSREDIIQLLKFHDIYLQVSDDCNREFVLRYFKNKGMTAEAAQVESAGIKAVVGKRFDVTAETLSKRFVRGVERRSAGEETEERRSRWVAREPQFRIKPRR